MSLSITTKKNPIIISIETSTKLEVRWASDLRLFCYACNSACSKSICSLRDWESICHDADSNAHGTRYIL
jgi:hypothetical protein